MHTFSFFFLFEFFIVSIVYLAIYVGFSRLLRKVVFDFEATTLFFLKGERERDREREREGFGLVVKRVPPLVD